VDWLKLSVDLPDHPKVAELSDRAFRALIASWCYAARFETDAGHVPDSPSRRLGLTPAVARELEEAGLMHRNGTGWHVHDWTEHQVDPAEMREKRDRRRAQWRESKQRKRLKENGEEEA
jgi:hypothetical protein